MWFRKLELQDPGRKCHGQIIREGEFKWQSDNSQGLKIGEYVLMRDIISYKLFHRCSCTIWDFYKKIKWSNKREFLSFCRYTERTKEAVSAERVVVITVINFVNNFGSTFSSCFMTFRMPHLWI